MDVSRKRHIDNGVLESTSNGSTSQRGVSDLKGIDQLLAALVKNGTGTNTENFYNALDNILNGNNAPDSLASLLASYFGDGNKGRTEERTDMFYQYLLQLMTTSDQRQYDWKMLQDSRQYNNPLNELARLTGAGIGRDAAIQILSNGSGAAGLSAIGSGAGSSAPGVPAPSGTMQTQRDQMAANIAFSAFDCLQSMLQMGLQVPQAIAQTKIMQNQAYMSQVETQSFQSVQEVTQALQNMVTNGILEPADFDSWQNAEDVYKWLNDHLDTNAVKPLVDSGAFNTTFGTRQGRAMFNDYFHNLKDSQTYGSQLGQYLRYNDLKNDLAALDSRQKQRDFWISFERALYDFAQQDQEIQNLIQAYADGQIQIQIHGEVLKQQIEGTKQARLTTGIYRNEKYQSDVANKVFQSFVENGEPDEPGAKSTGLQIMNYNLWSDFYRQCQYNLSDFSLKPYDYVDNQYEIGDIRRHRNVYPRDQFVGFLRKNAHVAYTGALVKDIITSGRLQGWSGNAQPIYQFFDIWKSSGANDFVTTTAGAAAGVALPLVKPAKVIPVFARPQ